MKRKPYNIFVQPYFYICMVMMVFYWVMLLVMLNFYVIADTKF